MASGHLPLRKPCCWGNGQELPLRCTQPAPSPSPVRVPARTPTSQAGPSRRSTSPQVKPLPLCLLRSSQKPWLGSGPVCFCLVPRFLANWLESEGSGLHLRSGQKLLPPRLPCGYPEQEGAEVPPPAEGGCSVLPSAREGPQGRGSAVHRACRGVCRRRCQGVFTRDGAGAPPCSSPSPRRQQQAPGLLGVERAGIWRLPGGCCSLPLPQGLPQQGGGLVGLCCVLVSVLGAGLCGRQLLPRSSPACSPAHSWQMELQGPGPVRSGSWTLCRFSPGQPCPALTPLRETPLPHS